MARRRQSKTSKSTTTTRSTRLDDDKQGSRPIRRRTERVRKRKKSNQDEEDETEKSESTLSSVDDPADDFEPPSDHSAEESPQDLDSDHIDSDSESDQQGAQRPAKKKFKSTLTGRGSVVKNLAPGPKQDEMTQPGLIAPFTMEFLLNLTKPECNDREWLILNDKTYKKALQNWKEFVDCLVPKLIECDWTIPKLPSKDLIHRLHRDVRFSNDKTPYKKYFSAGFSRTGKKGPWAGYYVHIQPGDKSVVIGGIWSPEKNELATIRNAIIRNSKPLRDVITDQEFVQMFGKPGQGKGQSKQQSIFGHEDELKNCPKINGIDKSHPDIDLLKLRTIAAIRHLPDELVLSDKFIDEIVKSIKVLSPLVQCINEMILPQSDDGEE